MKNLEKGKIWAFFKVLQGQFFYFCRFPGFSRFSRFSRSPGNPGYISEGLYIRIKTPIEKVQTNFPYILPESRQILLQSTLNRDDFVDRESRIGAQICARVRNHSAVLDVNLELWVVSSRSSFVFLMVPALAVECLRASSRDFFSLLKLSYVVKSLKL